MQRQQLRWSVTALAPRKVANECSKLAIRTLSASEVMCVQQERRDVGKVLTFGLLSISASRDRDLCAARFLVHSFCQRGFVTSLGSPPAQGELASEKAACVHVPASLGWKPKVAEPRVESARKLWRLGSWSILSCVAPDRENP